MSTITAVEFGEKLRAGAAASVVDVRTPAEFEEVHVQGAWLAPLDALNVRQLAETMKPTPDAPIFLLCKGGTRAGKAAEKFRAAGVVDVCVVEGGTEACVAAGVSVVRSGRSVIPLDGQVRIALGVMILGLWLLAHWVHYVAYLIPVMAGMLIFSGISGFCGMAILLGKAPWNQRSGCSGGSCCR